MKCKVTKMQEGGENLQPIQTEVGEYIAHLNGDITPVKAKKLHKNMEDDDVTDMLPEGSYVFSRDKKMLIDPRKKFKGLDLDITLGYGQAYYSEQNPNTAVPKEVKFTDIMKKPFTPSEYAKVLSQKYPVTDREFDAFSTLATTENKESRLPYLSVLKMLSEEKKPKSLQHMRYGGYSMYQYGGLNALSENLPGINLPLNPNLPNQQDALSSIPVPPLTGTQGYIDHRKDQLKKPISEKGDPYEYQLENGVWKTRKKGQSNWKDLNQAGIVEVEKRLEAGRYDNYKYKGSPATKRKIEDPVNWLTKTNNTPQENFNKWNNVGGQFINQSYNRPTAQQSNQQLNDALTESYLNQSTEPVYHPPMQTPTPLANPYYTHSPNKLGAYRGAGNAALAEYFGQRFDENISPYIDMAKRFFHTPNDVSYARPYKYGGEIPKYQLEGLVGAAAGALADIPFKIFNVAQSIGDRRRAKKDYRQTLREIEALKSYNTNSLNNSANMGYASTLGNYLTQDPSYNYLSLTDPIQRTNSTYQDLLNNISSERSNTMNIANQGINSFYRNAGNLGLSPNQAGNYAASMHANALNNASQQSLRLNEAYRNTLLNRSNALSGYDEALAKDQQYGQNMVRSNRNRLNSGLFQGVNQSYQGREQGLRDLENQSLAAKMGARNQQANFLTNNGYMQAHMFSQLGDALKPLANNLFKQPVPLPNQNNLQPGMSNYVPGTADYSNGYYGPYLPGN